jgi:hypothetical protein
MKKLIRESTRMNANKMQPDKFAFIGGNSRIAAFFDFPHNHQTSSLPFPTAVVKIIEA